MGKSTDFLINFVRGYLDGENSRLDLDLDYDHYISKRQIAEPLQTINEGSTTGRTGAPLDPMATTNRSRLWLCSAWFQREIANNQTA